jgi:hypothetical protein
MARRDARQYREYSRSEQHREPEGPDRECRQASCFQGSRRARRTTQKVRRTAVRRTLAPRSRPLARRDAKRLRDVAIGRQALQITGVQPPEQR